jgi:hypothetical protein
MLIIITCSANLNPYRAEREGFVHAHGELMISSRMKKAGLGRGEEDKRGILV